MNFFILQYPSNLDVPKRNLSRDVCRVFFHLVRSRVFRRITGNQLEPLQCRALVAIIVLYWITKLSIEAWPINHKNVL